jgi:hypothetical protein
MYVMRNYKVWTEQGNVLSRKNSSDGVRISLPGTMPSLVPGSSSDLKVVA